MTDFSSHLDDWRAWQESPWGRIRYRVAAETLGRTCASLGEAPLRVLDVGGGDGGDAISLMAPNPPAEVLAAAIRRTDLVEAAELVDARTIRTMTFGRSVRRVGADEAIDALRAVGFPAVTRYGIRCITDFIADDSRKHEPEFSADLEALELTLCDREPYVRTARIWHLVARGS